MTPATPTVTVNLTKTFTATTTGGATNTVTWSSGGVGSWAGNVWTAPASAGGPYTITATSVDDPSKTATTTTTVVAMPVASSLTPTALTITTGTSTTVTPIFSGGVTATIGTSGAGSSDLTGTASPGVGVSTGSLSSTKTYTLTVTNAAGTTATAACIVTVVPAPTGTFVASTSTPAYKATNVTVTPTWSGGTTSATVGTSLGASDISAAAASGVPILVQAAGFTATTTYYLRVFNAANTTADYNVTITPTTVSVTNVTPATPTVTVNLTKTFTATVTGGATNTVTWTATAGSFVGNVWTAPASAGGPYTITATSVDDPSKTAPTTATVVAAPTGTFVASTLAPAYKATNVTVTPTWSGGTTSATVGTSLGASDISAAAASGVPILVQAAGFTATTTYYLRVTNAASTTADYNVMISPTIVSVSNVSPANPAVTANLTKIFTATTTGGATNNVTWTATAGSFVGNVWTAPASAGGPYTITATSVDDPSKTATTTATVVAAPGTPVVNAPSSATSGQTGLTAFVSVQPGMSYNWILSSGLITNGQGTAQITFTAGAVGTTTVSCTVTNTATVPATATGNASVNVVALPIINSFSASPDTILTLSSSTLSFNFAGGTGVIDHGVGSVTSGVNVTVNPAVTTTYTLTVGTVTATATVTVGTAPVFSVNLPTTQSVALGATNVTFSVTTSGTPAVPASGYQWYYNGAPIGGATASSYSLGTVTSGMAGSYQVVATNSLGSTPSNILVLTVTTNHNVNGNVQLANGGGGAPGVTVSINTTPTATTATTDGSGNFQLLNIPDGTYTLTPSITLGGGSGPSAATFIPATQSVTVSGADSLNNSLQAVLGYTVSGTVTYVGSQTGPVYLSLSNGNGTSYGVSIPWPSSNGGAFSIRGVPPNQTYTLTAFMDVVGVGNAIASDPMATANNLNGVFTPMTGISVHLLDPFPAVTPTQPSIQGVLPFDGGAVVSYNPAMSSGVETAKSYDIRWTTDQTLSSGFNSPITFKATGDNTDIYFTTGLTNGSTYYFQIRGNANGNHSSWSPASSALIGPSIVGASVSGTIHLGVAPAPNAPLAVILVPPGHSGMPIISWIAAPTQNPSYLITGVPDGTYQLIAILDQNNNGIVDPGDLSNTGSGGGDSQATITVSGGVVTGLTNLTLSGASSVASVTTQHWLQPSNVFNPEGYQLNYRVDSNVKLPVNVALQLGADTSSLVDVGLNSNGGDRYQFWVPSNLMIVGAAYNVQVGYSDGTSEVLTPQVTGVLATSAFAQNLAPVGTGDHSGSNADVQPTFSWSAPSIPPVGGYTYQFWIQPQNGGNTIWQVPGNNSNSNGLPSSTLSLTWGYDSSNMPSIPNLNFTFPYTTYNWTVSVQDLNGNSGQLQVTYTP